MNKKTQFFDFAATLFTHSAPLPEDDFRSHDEWSSLLLLDLVAGIEDYFGIVLSVSEVAGCHSFAEVFRLIESKQA